MSCKLILSLIKDQRNQTDSIALKRQTYKLGVNHFTKDSKPMDFNLSRIYMKRNKNSDTKRLILLIIGLSLCFSCSKTTPLEELRMIGKEMSKNEQIEYSYKIKNYISLSGETWSFGGKIYLEKNSKDTSLGYRFINKTELSKDFYNGDYMILLTYKDSTALKKPLCDYRDGHMTLWPFLELSYAAIRNFLTDSLLSSQIDSLNRRDTTINEIKCTLFSFWANNILIDTHKKNKKGQKKIKLVVRNDNYLPMLYSQYQYSHSQKEDNYIYSEATFSDYSFNTKYPEEMFSIESVPNYFKWDKFKSYMKLLPNSSKAPIWKLPLVFGDSLMLSSLKGKVVLIDFWFIGCGACGQSIPDLNKIQAKFRDKGLVVMGINLLSNKVDKISDYCRNRGMEYINVWNGDRISNDYQVGSAAPIFYIIDKEGTIAYSQVGHDSIRLENAVNDIMNKLK